MGEIPREGILTDDTRVNRMAVWVLAFAALVIILSGLGLRDPWPADEPRFAQVAREMVESGNWFFPSRGGEPYPDKPPVFMWAIALGYQWIGSLKLAFLLPSALCGLATLYLVYDLGRRLWAPHTGLVAAGLLLVTLQFTLQAKTAQIDAMVCCWITLGCYGLLRHLLVGPDWRWYWAAWAFMGLGVITKGVGFLPALMLLPYVLARRMAPQDGELSGSWRWWLGPAAMMLVIGAWLAPMLWLVDISADPQLEAYRDNILMKQTATRYVKAWHHLEPFWYYLVSVIPLFWMPVSLMLPWLARPWWQAARAGERRIILPLGWVLLVIVFFSISPGKRGVYILPALPMLALAAAPYADEVFNRSGLRWLVWGAVACISLLFLFIAGLGVGGHPAAVGLVDHSDVSPWSFLLAIGLVGVASLVLGWRRRIMSWLLFIPIAWLLYSTWGYQLLGELRTPRAIFAQLERHVPPGTPVALVKFRDQFLLFSPFPTTHFGFLTDPADQDRAAWRWLQAHPQGVMIAPRQVELACFDAEEGLDLGYAHRKSWLMYGTDSLRPECPESGPPKPAFNYTPQRIYR